METVRRRGQSGKVEWERVRVERGRNVGGGAALGVKPCVERLRVRAAQEQTELIAGRSEVNKVTAVKPEWLAPIRSRVGNSRAFVYVDLSPCTCFRVQVSNETQRSKGEN
ncbi:Hypothetical protein NTJ_03958 [Nesidiocoris tenuis]|uniref:Uncharacterized protein n=1 Tax=Nesidiocoris tenuis TaxID=355587 RepID=A0ABN7AFX4_9HEMI|nr:Hypothetical protein NTJ_03958 [Nesidiocoris tenuis]